MTEFLDAKTIFVLTGMFTGLITVVFFAIHRGVYAVVNGVLSFAWAYGFFTLFALLLLMRGLLHPLITVVMADTALCLAVLMIADGVSRLKNQAVQRGFYRWYLSFCLVAFIYFTFLNPSFSARVMVTIICTVGIFSWVLLMLWRQPIRTWRLGEWIFSVSLLVSVIAAILRALTALVESETAMAMSILSYQGTQANYLTINLLATVFIAFGLIVMTQDNLRRDLERLASYDALTGVLTRRVILDLLDKSMAKVSRTGQPLAVMMIDLDHFKRINDNFGHRVGDRVLTKVIDAVESVLRKDTYIGRYGGEEFLIVMPDTSLEQLLEVSERIRQMAAKTVVHFQQSTIQCTISIGALIIDATNIDSLTDPVTHADKALYQAKQQGRNQVVVAGASPESSLLKTEST